MTTRRRALAVLAALAAALCAASASLAAGTHRPRHASHRAPACHPTRRHRCPKRHATKKLKRTPKPAAGAPVGAPSPGSGSTGAWSTVPAAVGPAASEPAAAPSGSGETPAGEAPAPGAAHVQVTAEDTDGFRFALSRPSVPAGKVVIEFVNHGQDEHNMHVLEPTQGSEEGALPNTVPGAHPSLSLNLRPGSYTLFCSLPGHEAAGMKATLTVN